MDDAGMSDTESNGRVTVRELGAKIDEVKAIIGGHAATTSAQLEAINTRLDSVPSAREVENLATRVAAIEADVSWRRGRLVSYALSLAAIAASVAAIILH